MKILFLTIITLLISVFVLSFNIKYSNKNESVRIHGKVKRNEKDSYSTKVSQKILCKGKVFNKFPRIDNIENKTFLKLLSNTPTTNVKKSFWKDDGHILSGTIKQFMFAEFNSPFGNNNSYINYNTRVDGIKLDWASITLLPTNGKFIMMIINNWEKNSELPPSRGYYLCTFKLNGDLLSIIYVYGEEEFWENGLNKNNISAIWGRAYCLNTNKPIVRQAVTWNDFIDENDIMSMDLKVEEIKYTIDEKGLIKTDSKRLIFPRTNVKWKDRAPVQYNTSSDTIRKMLGEIE